MFGCVVCWQSHPCYQWQVTIQESYSVEERCCSCYFDWGRPLTTVVKTPNSWCNRKIEKQFPWWKYTSDIFSSRLWKQWCEDKREAYVSPEAVRSDISHWGKQIDTWGVSSSPSTAWHAGHSLPYAVLRLEKNPWAQRPLQLWEQSQASRGTPCHGCAFQQLSPIMRRGPPASWSSASPRKPLNQVGFYGTHMLL